MNFVNPGFLYGLFAISIPVIIHLFNFRRFRKVYFTNVSFLEDLKLQTQKQSKLRHLIVLLLRIIAITAIVLAFAQPYIPASQSHVQPGQKNAVTVYVDNSFSMEAESGHGSLLDEAKEKAKEIAGMYSAADHFRLITNDFEGKHQRYTGKEEFVNFLAEVSISPVSRTLSEILSRQSALSEESGQESKTLYILSDFQKNLFAGDLTVRDTNLAIFCLPVNAMNRDNLFIDSIWFESPVHQLGQNTEIKVRIKNGSDNRLERLPVKLLINEQPKALASFDVAPQDAATVSLPFTESENGIRQGSVEINDNAITFDDKLFLSYTVSDITRILCVNGGSENVFLNSLFTKDSAFVYRNVSQGSIDYSGLSDWQLIILNEVNLLPSGLIEEMVKFTENGGSLLILPSSRSSNEIFGPLTDALHIGHFGNADTMDTRVSQISLEHPVYENVFDELPENINLPVVFKHFPIIGAVKMQKESLLQMMNGGSFLTEFKTGKGKVYLSACPFLTSFSTFPKHAIFVPTLYKIAILSSAEEPLYYTIGTDEVISVSNPDIPDDDVIHIKAQNSDFDFIPEHRRTGNSLALFPQNQVRNAGNYALMTRKETLNGISFNYNRAESQMEFLTPSEFNDFFASKGIGNVKILEDSGKPLAKSLMEATLGIRLWRWFVLLALLCLLTESLLLRFWK